MLTLWLHFKSDEYAWRAFDVLSYKILSSIITQAGIYSSWLKMHLLCLRYKTVAGMLLFFSSQWQGEDLFWEVLITEHFGKLVQWRLGFLPRALVRALRSRRAHGPSGERSPGYSTKNYPLECYSSSYVLFKVRGKFKKLPWPHWTSATPSH